MGKRIYKHSPESLASYMTQNLHKSIIVGETTDTYMIQNGKKMSSIPKGAVEAFALDHGFIAGQGYDALSEQDKGTFQTNRRQSTMAQREGATIANTGDEALQGYHSQLKSTRESRGKESARKAVDEGPVPYKIYNSNK